MHVRISVEIATEALRRGEEYALRDWLLLRAACAHTGHCRQVAFRNFLEKRGYRRQTIDDCIARLCNSGFARAALAKQRHDVMVPLSLPQLLARYRLGRAKWSVLVPIETLKGQGIRNMFFALVQAGGAGRPVARETWTARTGVSAMTQIRGEKRMGAVVQPNFARADANRPDDILQKLPCAREDDHQHRRFRMGRSVFIQIGNSVQYPHIPRRSRIVLGTHSNCGDNPRMQPTRGSARRYLNNINKARRVGDCEVMTNEGIFRLSPLVKEPDRKWRRQVIGVWGVV